jgi:hypothetical protein
MLKRRRQQGSVFIYVIGAVAIAALVAAGYLVTVDNGRERAARETDSATQEIDLEEGILAVKQAIERQALTTAQIDLATSVSSASVPGLSATFDLQTGGGATGVVTLENFADSSFLQRAVSLTMLGDPFFSARADIQALSLKATTSQAYFQSARASNKQVTENPEIDLRQIPLSEFTVYAAGEGIQLNSQTFASGTIGRIYARGDLQITGALKSSYPVVSGGQVKLAGDAELDLQPPGTAVPAARLSGGFDSSNAEFLATARTELSSQVITRQIFPMNASVTPVLYQSAGTGAGGSVAGPQINLAGFEAKCAVRVVASRQASLNPSAGSELASWVINVTGLDNSGSEVQPGAVPSTQGRPFAAAGHNGVTVLAFDYAAIGGNQPPPRAISIRIYNGAVLDTNALVLVRGADRLGGDLSIVSPHPIMISGDFNTQPVGGIIPAVSLVTSQGVQIEDGADALWARQTFGAAR